MRLAIRSLLVLCCLCGCGDGDHDEPARLTAEEAKAVAIVKEAVNPLADSGLFSGAVQLSKDGRTLFERAYGLADRTRKIQNALDTRFRVGSINKMFTAVAVMQLVEAGKLDLEAPLGTYLRDYPNDDVADSVTIHHLLTHTGGTGDIFGPEFDAHRSELRALGDYVELYGERGLEFRPGSSSSYSNYGFILLGVVIERVTGQSYYEYVQEQVYEPAGMTRTGSLPEGEDVEGRAIGYTRPPGSTEWAPNTATLPYRGTSAGGGYSTVGDLTRFAQALSPRAALRRVDEASDHGQGRQRPFSGNRRPVRVRVPGRARREAERVGRARRRSAGHERRPADLPEIGLRRRRARERGPTGGAERLRIRRFSTAAGLVGPSAEPPWAKNGTGSSVV